MQFYPLIAREITLVEKEITRILKNKPSSVYGMLLPFIRRGGKRLRPALVLLCCKALKGNVRRAIRLAALIEIFHNFTLIHDDICDHSFFRRGKPTLHREYGTGIALNSGDALYTLMWNELLRFPLPSSRVLRMQQFCGDTFRRVVEGQGEELAWYRTHRFAIREKDYFRMIGGKTASLIGLSCRAGAALARASPRIQKNLQTFGENIGLAFQIQDDVLNVTGTFVRYQKKIGEDISEGKRSLMVIHTFSHASALEKRRLLSILSSHTRNPRRIRYVVRLFEKYGSIAYAQRVSRVFIQKALRSLRILPDGKEKTALLELARFVIQRQE